jgi:glutamine cyclotransferase
MPTARTASDAPPAPVDRAAEPAEIVRELGPFPGVTQVAGVTRDGERLWAATPAGLMALDPATGRAERVIERPADAGTTFDGRHLWQVAEARIDKIDPATGEVLASIPAPGQGRDSGLAWAEGCLWVGQYRDRRIVQIDPADGRVLRTIESNRFVTGVTWAGDELWHGTWEGDESELRRVDPVTGEVLERLAMPAGVGVSGLESCAGLFYCGGGHSGRIRVVRKPARGRARPGAATAG